MVTVWLMSLSLVALMAGCESRRNPSTAARVTPQELGRLAESFYRPEEPGASILVARGDTVLLSEGYGSANLELKVSAGADTIYQIDSITKLLTATAILGLVAAGDVQLDGSVRKYITEASPDWGGITIERLLNHTSGIVNQTQLGEKWLPHVREAFTTDQLLGMFLQEPLDFESGTRSEYNNNNYVVLGAVIERTTGKSYASYMHETIFAPLRLKSTLYASHARVIPGRADGYLATGDGKWQNMPFMSMTHPFAAGGLMSSAPDLFRWYRALIAGELLPGEVVRQSTISSILKTGAKTAYGYGWFLGELRGRAALSHGGGSQGYSSHLLVVPSEDLFVAVLSNASSSPKSAESVARRLAALAMGEPIEDLEEVELAPVVLDRFTGCYAFESGQTVTIRREGSQLMFETAGSPPLEAYAVGPNEFRFRSIEAGLRFDVDSKTGSHRLVFLQQGREIIARPC